MRIRDTRGAGVEGVEIRKPVECLGKYYGVLLKNVVEEKKSRKIAG